jgi:hypothetical protein
VNDDTTGNNHGVNTGINGANTTPADLDPIEALIGLSRTEAPPTQPPNPSVTKHRAKGKAQKASRALKAAKPRQNGE